MLNICQENFRTSAGVSIKEIGGQQTVEIHYTNRKSFAKMILIIQQEIFNISIKSKQNKTKSIIIASGLKLKKTWEYWENCYFLGLEDLILETLSKIDLM